MCVICLGFWLRSSISYAFPYVFHIEIRKIEIRYSSYLVNLPSVCLSYHHFGNPISDLDGNHAIEVFQIVCAAIVSTVHLYKKYEGRL